MASGVPPTLIANARLRSARVMSAIGSAAKIAALSIKISMRPILPTAAAAAASMAA
jgi:hypothetical protein